MADLGEGSRGLGSQTLSQPAFTPFHGKLHGNVSHDSVGAHSHLRPHWTGRGPGPRGELRAAGAAAGIPATRPAPRDTRAKLVRRGRPLLPARGITPHLPGKEASRRSGRDRVFKMENKKKSLKNEPQGDSEGQICPWPDAHSVEF